MSRYLIQAQTWLALKRKPTNAEILLSELIQMRSVKKSFTIYELKTVFLERHPFSIELFRKTMHELKKKNILVKKDGLYTLNLN